MNRPIGIYEWCVLTQEMLNEVYPRYIFPHDQGYLCRIETALEFFLSLDPDAIERGEKLLREQDERREGN